MPMSMYSSIMSADPAVAVHEDQQVGIDFLGSPDDRAGRLFEKGPVGARSSSWPLLRADVVAEPQHVDAEGGQPPGLFDAQVGDASGKWRGPFPARP